MALTSSSIGNASEPLVGFGKYDVFINHRGVDTKDSLASAIYHHLKPIGARAFLDKHEVEPGEWILEAIEKAIRSASVQIAIFSPRYAESRWCLDELTWMLETGKTIIPVFYKVPPADLRRVRPGEGVYSNAFSKHENDNELPSEKLQKWKKALRTVSKISGLELKACNNIDERDERVLMEKVVKRVVKRVKKEMEKMPLLDVGIHLVGLDEEIKEFQSFVERSHFAKSIQNVKIVGIAGLGGSGKTTLVKKYFNQKRCYYTESSFLSEVRVAATENRLHNLQKQLLKDLVHKEEEIHNTSAGKRILEGRIVSVKALIVLDDVDNIDQIQDLLPLKGRCLHQDSLVIVTTRDAGVIKSSGSLSQSVCVSVYKKRILDTGHAKQLFCRNAFSRDSPKEGFEDLVEKFLKACQGLPLSLKVLGAQLYDNNSIESWKSVLRKISNTLPDKIKQILKASYDALDKEEQQMFLDVACFFIGEQKDMVISIWDASSSSDGVLWSGWCVFQILENKCLVEVDHENRIRMHDHLRDLGREIAIKETPSRFWSVSQFVNRPLKERLPMRGIMAATGSSYGECNLHYKPPFKECMKLLMGHSTSQSALGLQLLVVRGYYFKKEFAKLSEELVWLRWYDFPHKKLPSWLSTKKLRVLELYDAERMTKLWEPNAPPLQLRELIVTYLRNLQMIPETVGLLKHLKKIVLTGFNSDSSSLPNEFCSLESLEQLELSNFSSLASLPSRFGDLRKLKYIDLRGCRALIALPKSFEELTQLQYLDLSECKNLQLFPSKIRRQKHLRELCLSNTGLRELPTDIDRLTKLEVLKIGGSDFLTSLPTSLGNLPSLMKLSIKGCNGLEYLPSLGNLPSLMKLSIKRCDGLKSLPSLGNLPSLMKLNIVNCEELTHLPGVGCLTRLESLKLGSLSVKYLPEGLGQLVNLQNLYISNCPITELPLVNPEESKLPRLKSISLEDTKVATISISEDCCPSVEELRLSRNHDLMEIESLPTTLKTVYISECQKLEKIMKCPGLNELPNFAGLVQLQSLHIRECPELHELPSFACCTCLNKLWIFGKNRVMKIEGLEELRLLETLRLQTSWKVPAIKCLKNQNKLTTLQITAESRSAIERCIPRHIMKRACTMEIVGRAVEDVGSVLGSLSFPNLTVVDLSRKLERQMEWQMKSPLSNASCVMACFVISCSSPGISVGCTVGSPDSTPFISLLEGKQVYIGVWPKGYHIDDPMEGSERVFLTLNTRSPIQIEKGMAVIMTKGEEKKASELLRKFLTLLERGRKRRRKRRKRRRLL